MKTEIEKKQYGRFVVLNELYKQSGGNTSHRVDLIVVAATKGIKNGVFEQVHSYLSSERLIEPAGSGYHSSITHKGIKEIERVHTFPTERSEYFPALNEME